MTSYRKGDLVRVSEPIAGAWSGVVQTVRETAQGLELDIVPFYTAEGARPDAGTFIATADGRNCTVPIRPSSD